MRRAIAAATLAGLSACAVGPDYTPPEPPSGATAPLAATQATSTAETPDSWWRLYNDPRLDALLQEAFAANQDLKSAEAHLAAARAIYEAARAGRYPTTEMHTGGTYGRDANVDTILELTGRKPQTDWVFDALIDVSYEVDLFGHVQRTEEAAEANAEATAAARDAVKVTVAAETARAYAQICTLGEQIAVAKQSLDVVTQQQDITIRRSVAGAASEFDIVRSQQLVAQVRATIPPLEGQRRSALFELATLIGKAPSEAPADTQRCVTPPRLSGPLPIGDGQALLRRRPDVRQAERTLAQATAEIGVATADLYPRISLTGLFGGIDDKFDLLATNNALTWGVGPAVSWNFPIQAGPRARVREAEANAAGALSSFDGVVLKALQETAQALAAYGSELDHHAALADSQAKAERAFDLAQDQFKAGSLSTLDQLTTEQTLVAAEAASAASDAAIVQDQIEVFKALGGGWGATPPDQPPVADQTALPSKVSNGR